MCQPAPGAPFLFRLANGIAGSHSARELERYLHAVIAGVAAEHAAARNTG